MKIRISNRDLLLLLGILVAVIITVTTLVYKETTAANKTTSMPGKAGLNNNPAVVIKKIIDNVRL